MFRFLHADQAAPICRDSNRRMRGSGRLSHRHNQRGVKNPDWYNDILHNFLACYSVSPFFGCKQSLDSNEEILATGTLGEAIRGSGGDCFGAKGAPRNDIRRGSTYFACEPAR